jgi:Ferritin-like
MRTQMLRHLGPLVGRPAARGGGPVGRFAVQALGAAPPEFSQREYAVFLLSMAAEIEHSLMVQYLYAAWSLGGPQVPQAHRADIETWRRIMLGIAKEEMGHLLSVQNLLRLIGGPSHLDREDFPWISGFYPYAFRLQPATRNSVAKYVIAESPQDWPDSITTEERETIEKLAAEDAAMQVGRVGVLYQKLIDIFGDATALRDDDFQPETFSAQASFDDWGRGYAAGARGATADTAPDVLVLPSGNRGQAIVALKRIAEQGEATQLLAAEKEHSHFMRFLEIWRGLDKAKDWEPSVPMPVDPTLPTPGADGAVIVDAESAAWAAMFNLRYRMLLTWLSHALNLEGSASSGACTGRRGLALNRAFNEMYFLKVIAGLLSRRPLANDLAQPAGPPFQMPYTLNFPATEADFWRLHLDLVRAARENAASLPASGEDGRAFLAAMRAADVAAEAEIAAIISGGRFS